MKRSAILFLLPLLVAAFSARAAEMFEAYPKAFSLGYVSDQVNARYWFTPAWGLDMGVGVTNSNAKARTDDGVINAVDRSNSGSYSLSLAVVRTIRHFEYFDLNLKAGAGYSRGRDHADPEGPNNSSEEVTTTRSVFVGPEVEIKVPYFSRLVIITSIQAAYVVEKAKGVTESVAGTTLTEEKSRTFTFRSDGNSIDELVHIGVRYYF